MSRNARKEILQQTYKVATFHWVRPSPILPLLGPTSLGTTLYFNVASSLSFASFHSPTPHQPFPYTLLGPPRFYLLPSDQFSARNKFY